MMMSWMPAPPFGAKACDLIELFAGRGRISRLARARGWNTLSHDWLYDEVAEANGCNNCMDLCGNAGFVYLAYNLRSAADTNIICTIGVDHVTKASGWPS